MVSGSLMGTLASSATKTGRHDVAEVLLKVALKHQKPNKNYCSKHFSYVNLVLAKFWLSRLGPFVFFL